MAKNLVRLPGLRRAVACTHPTSPVAGDPVRLGYRTGLAIDDERANGLTVVEFGSFVATLSVKAVNDSGNSAVAVGDALFYSDDDAPALTKKASSGFFFGFALGAVGSGQTAAIDVAHTDSPGAGTLASGSIGTAHLANGAVTDAKLAGVTGAGVATVAAGNTTGGVLLVHHVTVPSGANGNVDVALDAKSMVLGCRVVLKGAGTAGSAITLKNGTNAITEAIDLSSGADKAVFDAASIDDARYVIDANGTLRVTKASTGGDFPGAEVFVTVMRVA